MVSKIAVIVIIALILAVLGLCVVLCAFGALIRLLGGCLFAAFGIREKDLPKKTKRHRIWSSW